MTKHVLFLNKRRFVKDKDSLTQQEKILFTKVSKRCCQ